MDVNDRAREEWVERTDGFERVRTTLEATTEPTSAGDVAERAAVSEKTARKYLQRMADLGVATTERDGVATLYRRNTEHVVGRRIDELRADHTHRELLDGIQRMREQVLEYRNAHGVDTAEELAVSLDPGDPDEAWHDLAEWRTVERNLALAQAALAVERAAERLEQMGLQGELDGEFGPTDVTRLRHLRTLLTETEPLVERATFDDSLDPRQPRVNLATGFDGQGRFDVRWSERGYYSIHYTEPDLDCRFDHHPNPHSPAKHFHPPPDAPSHDAEPSCIAVECAELVGLAVIQRWRAAIADDEPEALNDADDPP